MYIQFHITILRWYLSHCRPFSCFLKKKTSSLSSRLHRRHTFEVLPQYLNFLRHNLHVTSFLFHLSGSRNTPSLAGNPQNFHTVLVDPSSSRKAIQLLALPVDWLDSCQSEPNGFQWIMFANRIVTVYRMHLPYCASATCVPSGHQMEAVAGNFYVNLLARCTLTIVHTISLFVGLHYRATQSFF